LGKRSKLEETEGESSVYSVTQGRADRNVVTEARARNDNASVVPDTLGGYRLLRRLGSGGQGWVYDAVDAERQGHVALKVLRTDGGNEASAEQHRLKREFRAAADLNHRNVAKLYELGHDAGRSFCTMELIEGCDLVEHLQTILSQDDTREEVLRVVREFVLAVSALHASGLVHRDIKTANVMVERATGRVVLLDFGLAQNRSELTGGALAGTPGYLAPELLKGAAPSWASDWYGLGIVLYRGLCGENARAKPQTPGARSLAWPEQIANHFPLLCSLIERLLAEDPLQRPTGQEIAQALSLSALPSTQSGLTPFRPAENADIVGRAGELARLAHAYDVARAGRPAMVLIRGESGIGKSTLLQSFLTRLTQAGAIVLRGICHERELIPFRAIDDLVCRLAERISDRSELSAFAPTLCRAFPVLRARFPGLDLTIDQEPSAPLRPLTEGLIALIRQVAKHAPVVLAVEDLQWGDRDSARLMAGVLSHPTLPVLMVASWRDTDSGSGFVEGFEQALPKQHALSRFEIALGPLAPEATLQLLRKLAPDARDNERLAALSGGVPFVLEELTRARESGQLETQDERRVEQLLARRLADDCSSEERRFMELLAVAGRPMRQARLLALAGMHADAHALFSRLRNQRLIRTDGPRAADTVDVYHHRIRAAVIATLAPEQEATHHLCFARGLADDASADPAQVAHHYFHSPESQAGVPYAERAAAVAERAFAFEQAAELYRQVLHYGDGLELDRLSLSRKLAHVLELSGRSSDAAQAYLRAAELTQGIAADRARCAAAENFLASGHISEGSEALEPLFARRGLSFPQSVAGAMLSLLPLAAHLWLGRRVSTWLSVDELGTATSGSRADPPASTQASTPPPARAAPRSSSAHTPDGGAEDEATFRLDLYWAAAKGLAAVDPVRAGYFLCAGLKAAKTARAPLAIARFGSLFSAAVLSPAGGGLARWGRDLLDLAARVAEGHDDVYLKGLVKVALGQWHLQRGDWRAARADSEHGRDLFDQRCVGVEWETNIARMGLWRALEELGEFASAEDDLQGAITQAARRGDRYGEVTGLLYRAILRLVRDDLEGSEQDASTVLRTWTGHRQLHVQHAYACRARAMCALARGDASTAWQELDTIWSRLERSGMLRSPLVHIDFHGLRARCALAWMAAGGAPPKVTHIGRRTADRLSKHARGDARAVGLLVSAGIAFQQGQGALCAELLAVSQGAFDAAHQSIHSEVCRLRQQQLRAEYGEAEGSIAALKVRGVSHPRRWAEVIAPGFGTRPAENSG
jgi:hypothetical protein